MEADGPKIGRQYVCRCSWENRPDRERRKRRGQAGWYVGKAGKVGRLFGGVRRGGGRSWWDVGRR